MKSKIFASATLLLVTAFLLVQAIVPHAALADSTWRDSHGPGNGNATDLTMAMDGTAAIKDSVHGIPATVTGTPATSTLLGATAPVVGTGGYSSVYWPTAALGITPGMPISIVCVINSTGTWDDGVSHLFYISRVGMSSQEGMEVYKSAYGLVIVGTWSGGIAQTRAIWLDANNWAPNTPHIVIATVDADNNQRIFLDGVEGFADSLLKSGRETALGTNTYFGIHDDGIFPLNGSILAAVYNRVLTDAEIARISAATSWNNDILNPPPPPATTHTFYFAEGTCRPNFDPYFCIQNPGNEPANVTLTYMKGDGTTATDQVTVPKNSRVTVSPRNNLGTGNDAAHDFSTKVTSNQQIIAERPMYFNYNGVWTGGHDVVGATSPSTTFYFAEGTCRPNFDPYFCIQNPENTPADVTLAYMKGDGTTATDQVTVPPNSRSTVSPRNRLGTGNDASHDFSTKVTCDQQIIVERPMYFDYQGVLAGGSDVMGATSPASTFYFAEGTTRPNFDPYFCLQNPGGAQADVKLTYMKTDGSTVDQYISVPADSRATVHPADVLVTPGSTRGDFSTKVTCTNGQKIIAERPMYFNYNGVWTGGHDVVGATSPSTTFYFAEGTCRPNFDPYFCIQNPGNEPANVTLTYMKGDGTTATDQVTVPKNSRVTVSPRNNLGTGNDAAHDFSTKVTSNQQIIAERPMYFNYNGVWTGGHDVVGFTPGQ